MLATLVLENANNPGTGNVILSGAPSGRLTFKQVFAAGATLYYVLDGGNQVEWGVGTVTGDTPAQLVRNTVIGNTAGTTARLNFTGTLRAFCDLPAERELWADSAAVWQGQGRRFAGLGAATTKTDAAQLGQVAWEVISEQGAAADVKDNYVFALPAGFLKFRIECSFVQMSGVNQDAFVGLLASQDSLASFIQNNKLTTLTQNATALAANRFLDQVIHLTPPQSAASQTGNSGLFVFEYSLSNGFYSLSGSSTGSNDHQAITGSGTINQSATLTHFAIITYATGAKITGHFRLLGWRA